ncbi:MAG: hypothetical protein AB1Z38_08285 [Desulfotignum sp.]
MPGASKQISFANRAGRLCYRARENDCNRYRVPTLEIIGQHM